MDKVLNPEFIKFVEERLPNLPPNKFLRTVTGDRYRDVAYEYTYIIMGEPGPTGKTWLCDGLKMFGFKAFEITEDVMDLVSYNDGKNHYIINDANKQITIILNKPLQNDEKMHHIWLKSFEGSPLPLKWEHNGKPVARINSIDPDSGTMVIELIK